MWPAYPLAGAVRAEYRGAGVVASDSVFRAKSYFALNR